MKHPALPRLLALGLALLLNAPAFGQLTLTIQATETLVTDYDAGDPDPLDGRPASLHVTTDAIYPASLDYTGLSSGTFTLNFLAPTGYKFVITADDENPVRFDFQVAYTTNEGDKASGGLKAIGPGSFSLLGLEGTAPTLSSYHYMDNYPYAYLALGASADVHESFSFTGFQYTFDYTGTGLAMSNPYFEGGNLRVYDNNYTGSAPPDHSTMMTLSAVPEPSTYAAFAGAAVLGLAIWRRRCRRA